MTKNFQPRTEGADANSPEMGYWFDAITRELNINEHNSAVPVAADEVDFFDASANARRKSSMSALLSTVKLFPMTDAGAAQTACGIYAGTGAPSNANGNNGDYYFRSDGGVATHIYFKSAGAWAGII